ncbi:MAG: DUF805 domain-containing protein [Paracoccaceae bacterium]
MLPRSRRSRFMRMNGNSASFGQIIAKGYANWLNFSGHASRWEFWGFVGWLFLLMLADEALLYLLGVQQKVGSIQSINFGEVAKNILIFFPIPALAARRLNYAGFRGRPAIITSGLFLAVQAIGVLPNYGPIIPLLYILYIGFLCVVCATLLPPSPTTRVPTQQR